MSRIEKYINIIQAIFFFSSSGLKTILADRALVITDFFLGTTTPFLVQFLIWTSVYSDDQLNIKGFSYEQTIFYYAFALVIGRLNNGYDVIEHLSVQIKEGRLEPFLTKPFAYPLQRLSTFLGESIIYLIPVFIVYSIYSFHSLGFFFILFLTQILCFSIFFFIATISFWVIESTVLLSFSLIASSLFGGTLLPPEFWSEWLLPLMKYNPFRYMIAAPAEFIVRPSSQFFIETVLVISIYIFLFFCGISIMWKSGLKRYSGAGG